VTGVGGGGEGEEREERRPGKEAISGPGMISRLTSIWACEEGGQ